MTLFIFHKHLCLINEFRVNINLLEQKCFAKKIIKLLVDALLKFDIN
jgi:hypothetical protein